VGETDLKEQNFQLAENFIFKRGFRFCEKTGAFSLFTMMMGANALDASKSFDKLPDTYVIFITLKDVLGYGLPIAHIDRIVRENGEQFDDAEHFIYVDSSKDDGGELGRLMHDFRVKEAKDMQMGALADRVRELKETEKGVEHMCKEMEQLCDEARMDEKKDVARSMAEDGMTIDRIAKILKVDVQMVQEWLASNMSTIK